MKVCAISVLFKNPKEQIEKLEESLLANRITKGNIFFVDNERDNVGYGEGINTVLKKQLKQYDYFFVVNPDVIVGKNCLGQLLEVFERDTSLGIIGPKILDGNGEIWSVGGVLDKVRYSGGLIDLGKKNRKYNEDFYDVDYIPGTAMLIKREVFEKVGFFKTDYFLYYEDGDFSLRAKKAGFRLVISPHAEIQHFASSSTGKNSPLMNYYLARNHLLFVERFAPFSVKVHELLRLPKTWQQASKYEKLGMRDYFIRRFGKRDYWS